MTCRHTPAPRRMRGARSPSTSTRFARLALGLGPHNLVRASRMPGQASTAIQSRGMRIAPCSASPMSIDPTTSSTASPLTPNAPSRAQARKDFQSLSDDLQAGNLPAAQTDFASLLRDAPQLQAKLSATTAASGTTPLSALSSSLQAGDLSGAQSAMTSLRQSLHAHRHHHHHGAQSAPEDTDTTPPSLTAAAGATPVA